MVMEECSVFVRREDIIERAGEEMLLFDPGKGKLYELNETGEFIWKLLDGSHSISEIRHKLLEAYEEDPSLDDDIEEYIKFLLEKELITSTR
ncbi:PqqD family peptide modification chaperone [Candidatus Bathyarchaeota archaeon]|nr:PqqD family peptide modification chaperone [Candidatus Bathyarchaeota archaeon]